MSLDLRSWIPFCARVALVACACLLGCVTSMTGQRQLLLFPESQMASMGATAFTDMRSKTPKATNPSQVTYVRCVANAVTSVVSPEQLAKVSVTSWEVEVFDDKTANAFALPGGKIGVHTGLLPVANTPAQLAAVLGHEVGHVLDRHGNARMSAGALAQAGMTAVEVAAAMSGPITPAKQLGMQALGLGAQYGVIMPYGRSQESAADVIGLELMARAGFDPREAVTLWENMGRAGGPAPPEILSTHPSNATRIAQLQARIPEVLPLYEQARAAGRRPNCKP
ncbi:M48 family metallopeptidase, partial [Myxococcota bacterium]|nr:M48 family metallopeptidase [Myxococcota bacterium]